MEIPGANVPDTSTVLLPKMSRKCPGNLCKTFPGHYLKHTLTGNSTFFPVADIYVLEFILQSTGKVLRSVAFILAPQKVTQVTVCRRSEHHAEFI